MTQREAYLPHLALSASFVADLCLVSTWSNAKMQLRTLFVSNILFVNILNCVVCLARNKRSLVNYTQVVKCATDAKPIYTFSEYGCYCSGTGTGQPIDDIDRCCMNQVLCYEMLVDRFICTRLSRYLDTYDWECVAENSDHDASYAPFLEAIEGVFNATGGSRKQRKFPVCKGSKSYCGINLCYCDVQAALCFAKYKSPTVPAKCGKETKDENGTV